MKYYYFIQGLYWLIYFGSGSVLEDYFQLDGEVKNTFESTLDSRIIDYIFLGVVDLHFLDELMIDELNSMTRTRDCNKIPYFIRLLSENKQKVNFSQFSHSLFHSPIELNALLLLFLTDQMLNLLLYRPCLFMLENDC